MTSKMIYFILKRKILNTYSIYLCATTAIPILAHNIIIALFSTTSDISNNRADQIQDVLR